jgi:hypothetical protein
MAKKNAIEGKNQEKPTEKTKSKDNSSYYQNNSQLIVKGEEWKTAKRLGKNKKMREIYLITEEKFFRG